MIAIEIGPVPTMETPATNAIGCLLQSATFLRQLNRVRAVLPESGWRYIAQISAKRDNAYTIVLVGAAAGFEQADLALDLALSAKEVTHWDAQALTELKQCGLRQQHHNNEIEPALKYA